MNKIAAVVTTLLLNTPAYAAWEYEGQDSDFGGPGQHMALNMSDDGNYVFGFRCLGGQTQAIFLTPEILENADLEMTDNLPVRLLFKIDGGEAANLEATVDSALLQLRVTGENVSETQIKLARDAAKSISVAIRIGELVVHETRINARGSTAAISKFMDNCGILGE